MNEIAVRLHEAAIELENDGVFHNEYTRYAKTGVSFAELRNIIRRFDKKGHSGESREHLRRYFQDVWGLPEPSGENAYAELPPLEFWKDAVRYPPASPIAGQIFNTAFAKANGINDRSNWAMYGKPWIEQDKQKLAKLFWAGHDLKVMCEALQRPPNGVLNQLSYLRCLCFDSVLCKYFVTKHSPQQTHVELKQETDQHTAAAAEIFSNLSDSLKETTMSKTTEIIKIETKTLVNGVDIATMENSQIYSLIASQEAEIAELEKIKNKPKKLKAEIEKRQEGIDALVAHLDSKAE